jgi:hypothetical protein
LPVPAFLLVGTIGALGLILRQQPLQAHDSTADGALDLSAGSASVRVRTESLTGDHQVLGKVASTDWGDVQVRITMHGRKIVAVLAVQHPDASLQSRRINQRALPVLYRETTQAQSAHIDAVSGATVTSGGYRQSLQSAIDMAHLA